MPYPGGKANVYQKIINLIPPHKIYIEPFLGGGSILLRKRPAKRTIAVDIDADIAESFKRHLYVVSNAIELYCQDAVEFLSSYNFTGDEFIYADPPYLNIKSNRQPYKYQFTQRDHKRLLDCLKSLSCYIMISGYWSDLYEKELGGWYTTNYQAVTRSGEMATEWIWMNYKDPKELHDYRYLGDSFNRRQDIRRKQKRWVNNLKKMPELERQAMLYEIKKNFPEIVNLV